jgi:hypothetical protein
MLASALPWRRFPAARRQLQYLRPTVDPSVPPFAKKYYADISSAPLSGDYLRVFSRDINIGRPEREILVLMYGYYVFTKTLCTWLPETC